MDDDSGPISFLRQRVPPGFEVRVVSVPPGGSRAYVDDEWEDAIVLVEHGEIELQDSHGARKQFGPGGILCLAGLPLQALHNNGSEDAVLVAVSRRR